MTNTQFREIISRLQNIEKIVCTKKDVRAEKTREKRNISDFTQPRENYSGAIGGLRFLVKNKFFKTKRKQKDVRKELAAKNYHYSSQAIYEALTMSSSSKGPLVALKEKGQKVYAERK